MLKIVCNSCGKSIQLDETKLPKREVRFACPYCKTILTFEPQSSANEEAVPPLVAPFSAPPMMDRGLYSHAPALAIGREIPEVKEALQILGFSVRYLRSFEQAREAFYQDNPQLVVMAPSQLTMPPVAELQPLTSIAMKDRRRSFFVLVAEGIRTADGNAAFLYLVNLVVAIKDMTSFPLIYRDAFQVHQKLYTHYTSFLEKAE